MKITISLPILETSFILVGYDQSQPWKEYEVVLEPKINNWTLNFTDDKYEILLIDGCQYILYDKNIAVNLGFGHMSQKGNCNNPVHPYQIPDVLDQINSKSMELNREDLGGEKAKK